jgi:hypothetical protein
MQAATNVSHTRGPGDSTRVRALIRFNALLFHGLAVASFLEAAAPLSANRLARAVAADPDVASWVDGVWRPQRGACGRELRAYIEAVWPEFDWAAAYEDFCNGYGQRPGRAVGRTSPALEAVARCALESQAAVFYRAVAASADDPALRELARAAARDHGGCFEVFRSLFERCARRQPVGFAAGCRAVLESSRAARDIDVAAAFHPLAAHWYGTPTVTDLGYQEFLARMAQLIGRHAELGRFERLLFSPWLRRAVPALPPGSASRGGGGRPAQWPLKAAA